MFNSFQIKKEKPIRKKNNLEVLKRILIIRNKEKPNLKPDQSTPTPKF